MAELPKSLFIEHPTVVCRARFGKNEVPPKTLHYFAIQGLGEIPRLLLEYTETPYDSVMYFKTHDYKKFAIFGQMPCYQGPELPAGTYLSQSSTISRHLARQLGIWGKDPDDVILQDLLWEAGKDIASKKDLVHNEGSVDERLDGILKGLISLIKDGKSLSSGSRKYDGNNPCGYGEIGVFHSLYTINEVKPGFLDNYPGLMAFVKAVKDTPTIQNYLGSFRRLPLTKNEIGKGHIGPEGYTYLNDLQAETVSELFQ